MAQGHRVEIEVIKTTGDRMQNVTFAEVGATIAKGMFTLEIEEALASGRVDLAVHSLKDLPTELPAGFALGATPKRVDPRDVFVSRDYANLQEMPEGSRLGTSSARRRSLLRQVRPDLEYIEFRGNVDTRLRKLGDGQAEGIILAAAGLDRLEKTEWIRERLEPELICPAAGQGALGIEIRAGDERMAAAVAFLNDADSAFAVMAERTGLAALGGGCQVPIGMHCRRILTNHPAEKSGAIPHLPANDAGRYGAPGFSPGFDSGADGDGAFELMGVVAEPFGDRVIRGAVTGSGSGADAKALGAELAGLLLSMGASELLAEIGTR
jgi:hydroxymethylbilane synthase